MKVIIYADPKEMADFVLLIQGRTKPMQREEFKKVYQAYQKPNCDKRLKPLTDSSKKTFKGVIEKLKQGRKADITTEGLKDD